MCGHLPHCTPATVCDSVASSWELPAAVFSQLSETWSPSWSNPMDHFQLLEWPLGFEPKSLSLQLLLELLVLGLPSGSIPFKNDPWKSTSSFLSCTIRGSFQLFLASRRVVSRHFLSLTRTSCSWATSPLKCKSEINLIPITAQAMLKSLCKVVSASLLRKIQWILQSVYSPSVFFFVLWLILPLLSKTFSHCVQHIFAIPALFHYNLYD